ncbi:MAG: ABC transporter substrate-binding protein [Pseudomonadota bacterium]
MKKLFSLPALAVALAAALPLGTAHAADGVKIGVLTDMSGLFSDISGQGSVTAVQMAIDDFGGKVLGQPIGLVYADTQNKADIGAGIARQWYETDNVDMITDITNSAVAIAVVDIAASLKKIAIVVGAATSRISNDKCTPYSIHYAFDTISWANVTGKAILKDGGDSWFFLTTDFAFGLAMEKDIAQIVKDAGGKVVGSVKTPLNTPDFSAFLLSAKSSGAKVIALANSGGDTINAVKQAEEFKITKDGKQRLAVLGGYITDMHSIGLKTAQGLLYTEGFYWDLNDETRAWSKRFFEKIGRMPTATQAADYSSVLHYLKAVAAVGSKDSDKVMAEMRKTPVNDMFAKNGIIRADGRMIHDMYLLQVKKPEESKYPWDDMIVKAVVPGDEAFQSMEKGSCPLVKRG